MQVRFGIGPAPPEWTAPAPAPALAALATGDRNVTECRRLRLKLPEMEGTAQKTEETHQGRENQGRKQEPEPEPEREREPEQGGQEGREEQEGNGIETTPVRRPKVKVLVKTAVTVYRPRQTESTPQQQTTGQQQEPGQRQQEPGQMQQEPGQTGAGEAGGENLSSSSGGPGLVFGSSSLSVASCLLTLLAVVDSLLFRET